jgi:hypothetical protein
MRKIKAIISLNMYVGPPSKDWIKLKTTRAKL